MKTILHQLNAIGRYTLFAVIVTGAFYSIGYLALTADDVKEVAGK